MRRDAGMYPVLIAMALSSSALLAEEPTAALPIEVDLPLCVELAREHNPVIGRAREQVVEAEAGTREVGSSRRPQFDARGTYGIEEQRRLSSFGPGFSPSEDMWRAGIDASLNLFTGGRLKASERARMSHVVAARANVEVVEHGVFLEIAARYYGALLARQQVLVQEEALHLFGLQLERAETRFKSGAGAKFDVLQAKVAQANAKPPLVRARNTYRVEVDELRRVVGLSYEEGRDDSGIALVGDWPAPTKFQSIEEVVTRAMETRGEIRVSRAMLGEAREDWSAARRERAPSLEAYANYELLNDQFGGDGDDVLQGWEGGLRASLPIWNGGAIGSRVAQGRSRFNQALLDDRDVRLGIEVEARRAWFDVEQATEILETADLVIDQATEALRMAENRYKVGGLTQLDVIQSQLELTRARLEKAQAAHDYHLARARLRWAQGLIPVEVDTTS